MSGIQQLLVGAVPAGAGADANFKNTVLLLPGNGTNGAQNNTFLDSSTNAFSITRNGNTTQGTFSPFSQTGWSVFTGSSGSNELQIANSTNLQMGSGDFTAEGWFYPQASGSIRCFYTKGVNTTGGLVLGCSTSEIFVRHTGQTDLVYTGTLSGWNHIAWVRSGSTLSIYLNGTSVASATVSFNQNDTSTVYIGAPSSIASDSNKYYGYASNFRLVKGTAVYTANFTPPTAALTAITNTQLLVLQSNRFVDNSSNAFAITRNGDVSVQAFSPFAPTAAYDAATNGGSGYFDGTGDYLSPPVGEAFNFGTSAFTIECWAYFNSTAAGVAVFGNGTTGGNVDNGVCLYFSASGTLKVFGPSVSGTVTSTSVTTGQWTHLAVTRSSNTFTLYINGVSQGTFTDTGSVNGNNSSSPFNIGSLGLYTSYVMNGYISGFRVVKGTALSISVPTAPPTAISGTSLLCNFTNAGIYDATAKNDLETVGNAQISNTTAKFGSTSMYFDGTGDYLLIPDGPNLDFGTGDWTIEAWVNFSSVSSTRCIASNYLNSSSGWSIELSAGVIKVALSGDSYDITGTTTISTGTWYHVAVTKYGSSVKLFVNGNQEGSTYTGAVSLDTTSALNVGRLGTLGGDELNGYIQDLRITKGIARYTANFTAPTKAFALQ